MRASSVEPVGRDQAEDGVSQELEPLVVFPESVLVGEGSVGQGLVEQAAILEPVAEALFESIEKRRQG